MQAVDEAFAFRAEEIFGGHAAIGEDDLAGVAGAQAELVFLLAGAKAGSSLLDDERRDAVVFLRGVGDGHGDANVGVVAVGGEGLRAVEDPGAVIFVRRSVRVPPASEPASGSVSDQQPSFLPRASGTTYFCFCASVPNL